MKVDVLLGLQWGDEGKGKVVDVLTPNYNVIARFQGGPNAGHTLEFDGIKHVLHTIPSGIFHKNSQNIVGNGVVIDPVIFVNEINKLASREVDFKSNLLISRKAHLILPSHRLLDAAYEAAKGELKIGSTLKGIGPTYTDKAARNGLRIGDSEASNFKDKYKSLKFNHLKTVDFLNFDYSRFLIDGVSFDEYEKKWFEAIEFIKTLEHIDGEIYVNKLLENNKSILAEGAQGTLLDVDFGSYPFVTSSNTICAGVCTGLGISPTKIGKVIGIFKAYCTRVGSGPFPTELNDEIGETLRKKGNEFGSTTGRPRRCGWLDLPALKYSIMLNGVTELIMMKADVLSSFDTIQVCTHYKINDEGLIDYIPYDLSRKDLVPVYVEIPGWSADLTGLTSANDLPKELVSYIEYIENEVGVPIRIVSVGPDRLQTLIRKEI